MVVARKLRKTNRKASIVLHSVFGTQVLLGIFTVWSGVALWIAVLHQFVGALLVAATTWSAHLLGALPWLLLLACPLMHLFMHHGGHRHGDGRHETAPPAPGERK